MASFSDNFDRTNATTLGANWTQQEGADFFEIVSNQAKWLTGSDYTYERYNAVSADTPDMFTQAYVTTPAVPGGYPGITARCATSGLTCYALSRNETGWCILRYTGTGATETQIGSTYVSALGGNTTYKLRLEVSGTGATVTLKGYVDDQLRVDTTDTTGSRITSGTQGGMTYAGAGQYIFDNFSGGDLGGGTPGRMVLARAKA